MFAFLLDRGSGCTSGAWAAFLDRPARMVRNRPAVARVSRPPGDGAVASPDTAAFRPEHTAALRRVARPGTEPDPAPGPPLSCRCSAVAAFHGFAAHSWRAREADAGIRPDVHPGAPPGVGHHVPQREVFTDVWQGAAAGRPPGPPLAPLRGRLSGYRYISVPNRRPASPINDFPL